MITRHHIALAQDLQKFFSGNFSFLVKRLPKIRLLLVANKPPGNSSVLSKNVSRNFTSLTFLALEPSEVPLKLMKAARNFKRPVDIQLILLDIALGIM